MSTQTTSSRMLDYLAALGMLSPVFLTCVGMLVLVGEHVVLRLGLLSLALGVAIGIASAAASEARLRGLGWKFLARSVGLDDLNSSVSNSPGRTPYPCDESGLVCAGKASRSYTFQQEISVEQCSDEELVKAWLGGDVRASDELTERYLRRVQNFHYARERDWPRAWDLTQETFLKIIRNKHRLDPTKCFAAYLFTVATNTGNSWFKSKARSVRLLVSLLDDHDRPGENSVENTLVVEEAVAKLDVRLREVHELRMQGFTNSQIAEILQTSLRRVVGLNAEILDRLRDSLTRPSVKAPSKPPHTSPSSENVD
jgi:RNA polymerase sigma-70 factor, ECF subfamily